MYPHDDDQEERLLHQERFIHHPQYCGTCGYNLVKLLMVGKCPECGNEYNARPLEMKNIFLPDHMDLPWQDIAAAGLCLLTGILFIGNSLNPYASGGVFIGIVMILIGVPFVLKTVNKLRIVFRLHGIYRRILKEQEESE